jgi:hypothetical protein
VAISKRQIAFRHAEARMLMTGLPRANKHDRKFSSESGILSARVAFIWARGLRKLVSSGCRRLLRVQIPLSPPTSLQISAFSE